MGALLGLARAIDRINGFLGKAFAWLILAAILISAGNAVVRKAFNLSSNAWLEAQWYLFGASFLMCAAWTLRENQHVRVDVLSQTLTKRTRAWIDLLCHIFFLLPFAGLMIWLGWPYAYSSFMSGESSSNASGLILWPAKIWVLLGFVFLCAQGVSEIIKRAAMLSGDLLFPEEEGEEIPDLAKEAETMARS